MDKASLSQLRRQRFARGRLHGAVMDGFALHVSDPPMREAAEARLSAARLTT